MRPVAILGIGQTIIDEQWEKSIRDIAVDAIIAALKDSGRESADGLFVGNMMSGIINSQNNLGALIADWAGLKGKEAVKVEAACASGSAISAKCPPASSLNRINAVLTRGRSRPSERHISSKMTGSSAPGTR